MGDIARWVKAATLVAAVLLAASCGGGDAEERVDDEPAAAASASQQSQEQEVAAKEFDNCVELTAGTESVEFSSAGGQTLKGVLLGEGDVGVLLAHQYQGNVCGWFPFADQLVADGYRVLAFDFRGSGETGGKEKIPLFADDVLAAAQTLEEAGAQRIGAVGASLGATAVLVAAVEKESPIDSVAALSAAADYGGLDAADAVKGLKAPVLFMAGEFDGPFPADAKKLHEATASKAKELEIVEGSSHGAVLLVLPTGEENVSTLMNFLDETLK